MNQSAKHTPKHKITLWVIGILVVLFILVGGAFWGARVLYSNNLKPVAASQKSVTVTIPSGYSLPQISKLLKDKGLIRSEWAFKEYVRNANADNDIKAGTYELSPSYSVQEIVSVITEGKIKTNLITILPGKRLDQIRAALISSGFSAAEVDKALDPAQYKDHPALVDKPEGASLEGYLYPDSYQKTDQSTPDTIVRASLDQMNKHLTPDIRSAISTQGLSVYQGIILASVVEQEANTTSSRAQVAQVFLKRIRSGMNLQSDVTAFYGSRLAGQGENVNFDSPYNTYLHAGLPVGPVSNISDSSLQAVAHPANTDWLYFVSDKQGNTYFSSTLEEHKALTAQHCPECAQ